MPFLSLTVAGDELDTITITAEELPEVGEVELSEYTGSTERISREQLDREQGSIAELLANEAGVQYRQHGGSGSYSSITVRAATASQTHVYFDGVLLNNASGGGVDLSQLELLNLDSIDVYRGATPIQLGSASIGGAVNLRSRREDGNVTRVLLGIGSFQEYKAQLSRYIRTDEWDFTALVNHVGAENDFTFNNDNRTPLNSLDDREERRNNSEFSRQSVLLKAGRQVSESQRYDGSLQYADREQALPDYLNSETSRTRYDTGSLQLQLNRRTSASGSGRWSHTEGLFINRSSEYYDDTRGALGLGAQDTHAITNVVGGRSYWEAVGDDGTLALNLALRHEVLDQNSLIDGADDFSATRSAFDAALQYSVFRYEKLVITPALRLQSIADNYDGVLRDGRDSRSNSEITPQLGIRWQHNDAIAITSNVGVHHREPVFFELFGDRGLYFGNSSLIAEEGINFDVGAHWSRGSKASARQRRLSVTAFASLRDELIVSVYDSRNIGRSLNTGKAEVLGVESTLEWQWNRHWRGRTGFTAQTATNKSSQAAFNGKQLPGEAQLVVFASLQYQRGAWRAWYEGGYVGERYYDPGNFLAAKNYVSHNLGAGYSRNKFGTTLVLNNLGDENIEDFNGFPKPGRSFHLNLTYYFDGVTQ